MTRHIRFVANVPYQLVLFVGRGDPLETPARVPDDNMLARAGEVGGAVALSEFSGEHHWVPARAADHSLVQDKTLRC